MLAFFSVAWGGLGGLGSTFSIDLEMAGNFAVLNYGEIKMADLFDSKGPKLNRNPVHISRKQFPN
jgi:hypothetical protein